MQNKLNYKSVLGNKNIQLYKNKYPQCKLCSNTKWHPKILFSFDLGAYLIYYCNCKQTMIEFEVIKNAE